MRVSLKITIASLLLLAAVLLDQAGRSEPAISAGSQDTGVLVSGVSISELPALAPDGLIGISYLSSAAFNCSLKSGGGGFQISVTIYPAHLGLPDSVSFTSATFRGIDGWNGDLTAGATINGVIANTTIHRCPTGSVEIGNISGGLSNNDDYVFAVSAR